MYGGFTLFWRFFVAKKLARDLINAGAHFGHSLNRWNPKMASFIFAKRGNIHIIDIKETLKGLLVAKKLLANVVSSGKDVLFVGTKRQAQKTVEAVARKCGMHYVSQRWLGGMLTNFRTIRSRLQRLEELEAMQQDGTFESESKKQASRFKREMRKIKANLEGVRNMSRLPGAVVVVDGKKENLALREAKKLDIPTVGLLDTDSDPDLADTVIPINDDSIRAIELMLNELADAVAAGKTMAPAAQEQAQHLRRPRSKRPVLARADDQPQDAGTVEQTPAQTANPTPQESASEQRPMQ